MTAALITYPTAPVKRTSPRKTGRNTPSGKRSGGGAGQAETRQCVICGKRLEKRQMVTCGASHRVTLSKLKRKLCDGACVAAFGWQPGEGEALIVRYGLPQVEKVLAMRGIIWQAEKLAWVWAKEEGKVA